MKKSKERKSYQEQYKWSNYELNSQKVILSNFVHKHEVLSEPVELLSNRYLISGLKDNPFSLRQVSTIIGCYLK